MKEKLKVLLVGGGGREHALGWKLDRSSRLDTLYIAPGNPGTADHGENVPIAATNVEGLLDFATRHATDVTVVGMDDPLALGIVDAFQAKGLAIFGPTKAAASGTQQTQSVRPTMTANAASRQSRGTALNRGNSRIGGLGWSAH
jgi:phosphoribosylamine-glycine ligase